MQTTKQATWLRTGAPDYVTLVQQAINKVSGFEQLYKELDRLSTSAVKAEALLLITPGS